ncbi:MAG: glycosyltransferase family 1 protein [Bacteroidetes bacterium HGW-Bacteroidetes-5]|jgi:glycosyltransferase involved in cell wall biosynthesis|nr:MAG: glycosyltransferase family 1 protein [Bacteroidetes bacterium HGW-Bacteroidetes-5]
MRCFNVLYIAHYSGYLGANRSLFQLIVELCKNNLIRPIVLIPAKGEFSEKLEEIGVSYIFSNYTVNTYRKEKWYHSGKGFLREIFNFITILKLLSHLKKEKIDLVHSNSSVIDVGVYLAALMHKPHIWHIREFARQHYKFSYNLGNYFANKMYSFGADRIIVISKALQHYYSSFVEPSKIRLVYNGIEISSIDGIPKKKVDIIHIATVGLLHPSKHQDVILKAISIIIHKYKISNIHLNVFGEVKITEYTNLLNEIIKKEGIEEYVTFHGYKNNIINILKTMDIGILASEFEAFGRVTVEYMLTGLVPIVSNSGANTEIIQDEINGYVFKLNDEMDLAKKIVLVIKDPYKSHQICTKAYECAVNNYSSELNANKIYKIYKDLLA